MSNPQLLISLTCTLRPRRDDHGHRRTEALARADRRGTRTSRSPRIRLVVEGERKQPNPQNPVTDSVESCLLQGLRYYEFRRAVIIRSICRPKFVCVPTAPAQLRGVRFS